MRLARLPPAGSRICGPPYARPGILATIVRRNRGRWSLALPGQIHCLFKARLRGLARNGAFGMTFAAFWALLPMLFGLGIGAPDAIGQVRRVVVEEHLILRVPLQPAPRRIKLTEGRAFKCIHSDAIRGAFLAGSDHVDFLLPGRHLIRAKLEDSCPALDFYGEFYLSSDDGRICAKRDSIRSRMGQGCRIEQFRQLVRTAPQ